MEGIVIPKMLTGDELIAALTYLPPYDDSIREKDTATRLNALSCLFDLYIPSQMSVEIYSKLYLSLIRSISKKRTKTAIQQNYITYNNPGNGIIGGSDSYTIIGCSGIGKSSAINRAISLIGDKVIETTEPYSKLIPFLNVQCPFDASVKGLLLEILRKVDDIIGTTYYVHALRSRTATTDMLINAVCHIGLQHIGVLIVDECQNVVNSKNGKNLVGMLTQLINSSGISICLVGTPECTVFFEQAFQLARRSVGLCYNAFDLDDYFCRFCATVFSYQYVREKTEISPQIIEWLYEHSGNGNVSIIVSLIYNAMEIAILTGSEILNIESLMKSYTERIAMLHKYIHPKRRIVNIKAAETEKTPNILYSEISRKETILSIVADAKASGKDVIQSLKTVFTVEEVSI